MFSDYILTQGSSLWIFFIHLFNFILQLTKKKYYKQKRNDNGEFKRAEINDKELKNDKVFLRAIADHIAGMTDQYASREYKRLYMPEY